MRNLKKLLKIGMTAIEVIVEIVKVNPWIVSVFLSVYTSARYLKDPSLDRVSRHNSVKRIIEIPKQKVTIENLNKITSILASEEEHLAFVSKVILRNQKEIFYIPLMDFSCGSLSKDLAKIENFLRKIGQKRGVILFSGESYHYYGAKPLSEKERLVFLGRCLLFDYADKHYIGHQLIEGYEILRITKSAKYPKIPIVVSAL